jgi:Plasma-membrane choline transporter
MTIDTFSAGHLVRDSDVVRVLADMCYDSNNKKINCCAWEVDPWVRPVQTYAVIVMLWTAALIGQMRVYTVASAVSQWCVCPALTLRAPATHSFRPQQF